MTTIIFIHGINVYRIGYSNRLFKYILQEYKKKLIASGFSRKDASIKTTNIIQKEISWSDKTLDATNRYLTLQYKLGKRPGKWNFLTKIIDPLMMQILYYVKDKGHRDGPMSILKTIDRKIRTIYTSKPDRTIIIAHSLGSVIAYDYCFGFRKYKLKEKHQVDGLITLGSPIPMFTSAMGFVDNKLTLPPNVHHWINILDSDDGIARHCKPHYKSIAVEDIEINTGWDPIGAHLNYWKSVKVASTIADNLIKWQC